LFPSTRVPVVPARAITTPHPPLPEITLPVPPTVPPIWVFVLKPPPLRWKIEMPWLVLPRSRAPVTSVPM